LRALRIANHGNFASAECSSRRLIPDAPFQCILLGQQFDIFPDPWIPVLKEFLDLRDFGFDDPLIVRPRAIVPARDCKVVERVPGEWVVNDSSVLATVNLTSLPDIYVL
jgi:hypothetical protein